MKTLIRPIPEDKQSKRGWKVTLNGEVIEYVELLKIENPNFFSFTYGMTPAGYDGSEIHENGGGGVVTVPYAVIDGKLFIGLLQEYRFFQGGDVLNVPRGFINPGETHFEAMQREFEEEVGMFPDRMVECLSGELANPNSAIFNTAEEKEGVKFYTIKIAPKILKKDIDTGYYVFDSSVIKPVSKIAEKICGSKLVPWREAALVGDLFTLGIGFRFLASLPGISM